MARRSQVSGLARQLDESLRSQVEQVRPRFSRE